MYDCVILAGGFGKRLMPVTSGMPKPLAEIGGEPVLAHALRRVSKVGVERCALTLMYEGEQIKQRFGKNFCGLHLDYYTEKDPLGTAGGIKRAAQGSGAQDIIVLSGDGIFDFDLSELIRFHEEKDADLTVCTYYADDPTEYGSVICDPSGRIIRFSEKAPWSKAMTGRINTGIYIMKKKLLDMIPDSIFFDFAKDLFPMLLREDKKLYAKTLTGYWCDIGSLASLYECNRDALSGAVKLDITTDRMQNALSSDIRLGDGVRLKECALGKGVTAGKGSSLSQSFVFEGASIGENCIIKDCIISKNARVADGEILCGVAVGANGEKAPIHEREDGFVFTDGGVTVDTALADDGMLRLGAAVAKTLEGAKLGVTWAQGAEAEAEDFCGGALTERDSSAVLLGEAFPAMAAFAAYSYSLGMCAHVSKELSRVKVSFYDSGTLPICNDTERRIRRALSESHPDRTSTTLQKLVGLSVRYTDALMKSICSGGLEAFSLEGVEIGINRGGHFYPLKTAMTLLDARVVAKEYASDRLSENALICNISEDGYELNVNYRGTNYGMPQICAVLSKDLAERGEYDICSDFVRSPEFQWADDRIRVEKYSASPEGSREALARLAVRRKLWTVDASFTLIRLAAVIKLSGKELSELCAECRPVHRRDATFACVGKRMRIMDALLSENAAFGDGGAVIKSKGGVATVSCNREESLRVVSYAASAEAAQDLCNIVIEKLKNLKI